MYLKDRTVHSLLCHGCKSFKILELEGSPGTP